MSLKAKLEAVIYAAEEPVTLTQLAALFAADALEWKAAQQAAAAEQTAEVAGEMPQTSEPTLLGEGLEYLGMADTAALSIKAGRQAAETALAKDVPPAEQPAATKEPAVSSAAEAADETRAAGGSQESEAPSATEVVSGELASESPTLAPDHPSDEDLSLGTPERRKDGARDSWSDGREEHEGELAPIDPEAEARRLARQREREIKSILKQILDELIAAYESDARGVEIREIAGGYRMATKPECHDAVRLFVKSLKPPMRLSLPALETLAVVAYKQPVTSPEVNEIRGVESAGVLGSLLARKLIATAGRKPVIGRPILYKTTREFLLRFGLKDLSELPSMEEFEKMAAEEIEEMEPEVVAADAAAEAAESVEDLTELEDNSPSGLELAELEDATQEGGVAAPAAQEESLASCEDSTGATPAESSTPSNEQDARESSPAAPAEPEASAPAENEAIPDAKEIEKER
ncbi:MAG TPA: SMC-Scp complex subunit ScpB [Terracidiphilus sp.]|jgi:segregation and condensation protein B|nr:SMC-Scp complex subunit ScpB [Terracidiphilus sp.]